MEDPNRGAQAIVLLRGINVGKALNDAVTIRNWSTVGKIHSLILKDLRTR